MSNGQRRAFTLVELVITVAIIAVVSGASLISFYAYFGRRVDAEARKLAADLAWARQMCVARHQDYRVVFDAANNSYDIFEAASVRRRQRLALDITGVTDPSAAPLLPAELTFYWPAGNTQDARIGLSHNNRIRNVTVFGQTGYVKVQ